MTKAELLKQIRVFSERTGNPVVSPAPDVPRFRDGTARDALVRAEEAVDIEHALADPAYFGENKAGVLNLLREREARGAEERQQENEQVGHERVDRRMVDMERVRTQKAAQQARYEAWQTENTNRRIDGLQPLPMPKEEA